MIYLVVPADYPFVVATCLEFASKEIADGNQLTILNFACLMPEIKDNPKSRAANRFKFKPTVNSAIISWCKKNKIRYFDAQSKNNLENMIVEPSDLMKSVFDNCIRALYAKKIGAEELDINYIPKHIYKEYFHRFLLVHSILSNFFDSEIDLNKAEIVTVNGRFLVDSSILLFSKINKIKYRVLEGGLNNWNHYMEFQESIQSLSEIIAIMNKQIEIDFSNDATACEKLAIQHMNERLSNNWYWNPMSNLNSIKNEIIGDYIAFFPTSNWEFGIFDHELHDEMKTISQKEAFMWTAEYCKRNNLNLVVRVHPHPESQQLADAEDSLWKKRTIEFGGVLIKSNDNFNSHQIAKGALVNVVHQSSIGAEFLYAGLPTAITNETLYTSLVPEFCFKTKKEFELFIKNPVTLKDRNRLLPWAYFMDNGGETFKYFRILDNYNVLYLDRDFLRERKWFLSMLINMIKLKKILKL
jgi:hypothetical protein